MDSRTRAEAGHSIDLIVYTQALASCKIHADAFIASQTKTS